MKTALFVLGAVLSFVILTIDAASVQHWSGPQSGRNFGGLIESEASAGSKSLVRREGSEGESHAASHSNSRGQNGSGSGSSAGSNAASSAGNNGDGAYSSSNSWAWASG
ncbi:hyphally-regulated protein-like isoform X3 [Neodiprion virginianus]|uniref:hyphally-regulated protein-like isoform X3 n=1 Tax=Neodiprion virginianus TaxID=2961670 RepID=UPI001EE75538|nr:hyphally-regulated protein-like isoform X3 [Neodiprion virginianus]